MPAQEEARLLNCCATSAPSTSCSLIHEGEGVAAKALERASASPRGRAARSRRLSARKGLSAGSASPSSRAKKVLELSLRGAAARLQRRRGTEHPPRAGSASEGVAAQVLVKLGADLSCAAGCAGHPAAVRLPGWRRQGRAAAVVGAASSGAAGSGAKGEEASDKGSSQILDQFGRNLTQLAREKKLDPVIGRSRELERVMQILSRRTKNNPVLIGEPGVGKTAIVEGLAQKIVNNDIPDTLRNKQPQATFDLGALVAGSRYRWRLRGAPQEGAQGDQDPRRHRAVHRHPHAVGMRRRGATSTRRASRADAGPAASCRPSGPLRSTSTASTWRRTPRWSAASSRCSWRSRPWPTPSRSSRACATSTRRTTG